MNSKRFGHFMAYMEQLNEMKSRKPRTSSSRRVQQAKLSLKTALAAK